MDSWVSYAVLHEPPQPTEHSKPIPQTLPPVVLPQQGLSLGDGEGFKVERACSQLVEWPLAGQYLEETNRIDQLASTPTNRSDSSAFKEVHHLVAPSIRDACSLGDPQYVCPRVLKQVTGYSVALS